MPPLSGGLGQTHFIKFYSVKDSTSLGGGIKTANGGYLLYGKQIAGTDTSLFKIYTDSQGNVLKSKNYNFNFYQIKPSTDSGFFLLTKISKLTDHVRYGGVRITKIDKNSIIEWMRSYYSSNSFILNDLVQSGNDACILTGYVPDSGSLVLIKTDSKGRIVWSKEFKNANNYNGIINTDLKNNIIVAGRSLPAISKFNSKGDILWSKTYLGKQPGFNIKFSSFKTLHNGGILLTGTYGYYNTKAAIMEVDSNGDILWSKAYGEI